MEMLQWTDRVLKLLNEKGGTKLSNGMARMQEDLQALLGGQDDDHADPTVGAQLRQVLQPLVREIQMQSEFSQPLSTTDLDWIRQVTAMREKLEKALEIILPVLTPQENAMFEATLELIASLCELRQFGAARNLVRNAGPRATAIAAEGREAAVRQQRAQDEKKLRRSLRSATEGLGARIAPWTPFLTADDKVECALFASMLQRKLDGGDLAAALGIVATWSERSEELPGEVRARQLLALEPFAGSPEATGAGAGGSAGFASACAAVQARLASPSPSLKDIVAAQRLLDTLPTLTRQAREAAERQDRLNAPWRADQDAALEALRRVLARLDDRLQPRVRERLQADPLWQDWNALCRQDADGNQAALKRRLDALVVGLSARIAELGMAAMQEGDPAATAAAPGPAAVPGAAPPGPEPREIDDIAALLHQCRPARDDTLARYPERRDVVDFLGENWLSFGAYAKLAAVFRQRAPGGAAAAGAELPAAETPLWTVIDANPRVWFTERAALEKAHRIIRAIQEGAHPRIAAREEGCSTPSWNGDMLEFRLSHGMTQLRLIAFNVGAGQMAFRELKSFHAAGEKSAGRLHDYVS